MSATAWTKPTVSPTAWTSTSVAIQTYYLLWVTGGFLLQENGFKLIFTVEP